MAGRIRKRFDAKRTLAHALVYLAQQYRRAQANDDRVRAVGVADAYRLIAGVEMALRTDTEPANA